jgi:hypothetical protein
MWYSVAAAAKVVPMALVLRAKGKLKSSIRSNTNISVGISCAYLGARNDICGLYLVVQSAGCGLVHRHAPIVETEEAALLVRCSYNKHVAQGSELTGLFIMWPSISAY